MLPGNLTIQPANMSTFQSLGVNQAGARSIALPPSNVDHTKQTATIMPVSVSNKVIFLLLFDENHVFSVNLV